MAEQSTLAVKGKFGLAYPVARGFLRRGRVEADPGEIVLLVPNTNKRGVEQGGFNVSVYPGGGATGQAYYTDSPIEAVQAGTAVWIAWTPGAVAVATTSLVSPDNQVTAIRITTTTDAGHFVSYRIVGQ